MNGFLHGLYLDSQYAKKLKYANMTIICLTNILRSQDVEEMNKTLAATLNYLFAGTPSKSN